MFSKFFRESIIEKYRLKVLDIIGFGKVYFQIKAKANGEEPAVEFAIREFRALLKRFMDEKESADATLSIINSGYTRLNTDEDDAEAKRKARIQASSASRNIAKFQAILEQLEKVKVEFDSLMSALLDAEQKSKDCKISDDCVGVFSDDLAGKIASGSANAGYGSMPDKIACIFNVAGKIAEGLKKSGKDVKAARQKAVETKDSGFVDSLNVECINGRFVITIEAISKAAKKREKESKDIWHAGKIIRNELRFAATDKLVVVIKDIEEKDSVGINKAVKDFNFAGHYWSQLDGCSDEAENTAKGNFITKIFDVHEIIAKSVNISSLLRQKLKLSQYILLRFGRDNLNKRFLKLALESVESHAFREGMVRRCDFFKMSSFDPMIHKACEILKESLSFEDIFEIFGNLDNETVKNSERVISTVAYHVYTAMNFHNKIIADIGDDKSDFWIGAPKSASKKVMDKFIHDRVGKMYDEKIASLGDLEGYVEMGEDSNARKKRIEKARDTSICSLSAIKAYEESLKTKVETPVVPTVVPETPAVPETPVVTAVPVAVSETPVVSKAPAKVSKEVIQANFERNKKKRAANSKYQTELHEKEW